MGIIRAMTAGALVMCLSGCAEFFGEAAARNHEASSSLVDYLYGNGEVPRLDAPVQLELPIRVGVSFLPSYGEAPPSSIDRAKALDAIRENFKSLPYVSEIVLVPDYYLQAGHGGADRSDGFTQIEQLSRLYRLDLFALVSYDQITDRFTNKSSFFYITIVGAYVVHGDRNETHTLLDLAVVDPYSRSLIMRAGGVSSLGSNTTVVEAEKHEATQRSRGFELATANLVENFKRELVDFEARVKAGDAPVQVAHRTYGGGGGGGALDPALLLFLAALGARVAWRRRTLRPAVTRQRP